MQYNMSKPHAQILEMRLKNVKHTREFVTASLLECENYLLTYDPNRDEDERLQEIYYYERQAEYFSSQLKRLNNKIELFEKELALAKNN